MFRSSLRVIGIGGKICRTPDYTICAFSKPSSLRLIQSSAQGVATSDKVNRSLEVFRPQLVSITNSVQDLGFNEDEIKKIIQNQPDLIKKSPALWNSILDSFVCFGLEKDDILNIIEGWPHVLSLKKSELEKNLQAWFDCGFGEELTLMILTTHPYLLKVNHLIVEKRVKQYQIYFESKKRVGKLLLLAPNTLDERWEELREKLNYLDELCTEKSDIASTGVLAHSDFHLQMRHEILIRAGIYKRPTKAFHKKLSKNPKLTDIVNLSDKSFVKMAGLSLPEYEVFQELFKKEYEECKNDDLDEEELNKLSFQRHHKSSRR